ncbi:MAG: YDG domain-containing protein [Verrucomicrobiota bacterium]
MIIKRSFVRRMVLKGMAVAISVLAGSGNGIGQTYQDNQSLYSNQDPNTETRRSEHMRVCFGHYNRDSGMGGMSEQMAQGNLQMFEQMWNRWVNEMGLHDINTKAADTVTKYRSNFNFLMTWNDGGGGGAYSSGDPLGYGYAMANPGYCMFDPPSGATPHENGHAWEIDCGGFNGTDSSGAWWECTANWMELQLENNYPGPGNVIYNPMYYPAHGRDYYDTWTIYEAAKDDPRYGAAWVNTVWTDATADQAAHEYILDRMIRCDSSGSADKAGGFKDLWGDMVKKLITWDYARHQWFISANAPDDGTNWEFFRRCRTPVVAAPGMPGWFRPARAHWPMEFGFNLVPLSATAGTTVTCNFRPFCDASRQSDWRACLVAVNNNGDAHYSTQWNAGTNSITLSADEAKLYLAVAAVPKPMKVSSNIGTSTIAQTWQMQLTDAGLLFPYAVQFTNASPRNVSYAKPTTGVTWKSHTNPDSTVCNNIASGATVDSTAYVGPNAMVLDSAQVLGNAKVMDYAVVRGNAQVRETAEVSGYALVQDSAQIYGHAKVRDWAEVYNNCTVYGNGKVIEHGYVGDHGNINVSGSSVVKGSAYMWTTSPSSELSGCLISDGDTANGGSGDHGVHFGWNWGPDPTRFTNLADNTWQYACYTFDDTLLSSNLYTGAFARDFYGVNHGLLINGCRPAVDSGTSTRGGYVLPLDGASQYVELPPSANDFSDMSVAVWVKWAGTAAGQRIWSMGDGSSKEMYLTPMDDTTGKLRIVIGNGTLSQSIDGAAALGAGWNHVAVTITGSTATLYVNGAQAGQNTSLTLAPDQLNAPLMQNANYLGRGNSGNYFQGSLDEFRLYMKSLTATEIGTLFATAAPAPVTLTPDTTPPDAPTWLVAPTLVTDDTATMSANPGNDASAWIEYSFHCVSGGGHDSGWVSFNKYTDVGLIPGSAPRYTVQLRDRSGNMTAESASATATGTPSTLGTPAFSYGPIGIADGQITMSATKSASASGKVEYKFDRLSPTVATSGWQASPNWTNTGLAAGTSYTYTVTIRDNRGNTSTPSASAGAVARDDAGPRLCVDFAHWVMQPYATIDNKVSMTAQTASDPNGVQYFFHCVSGGGPDSAWQDSPTFLTSAVTDGSYVYQYKLRDKSPRFNESGYSLSYAAKITPTTGYHPAAFAQLTSLADDSLVTFNGVVLQANADHYVVKDPASSATITVKPNTYGQATDSTKVLKLCQIKGHLWTYGGTRLVTYAAIASVMNPPSFAISGKASDAGAGTGIAGATVYLSSVPGAVTHSILTATTDSSGNFSMPVPNGTWYVTVAAVGHFPTTEQTVTVNGYNLINVNFTLDPANTISASVVGTGGAISPSGPVLLATGANQAFTITPFGGQSIASVVIDGVEQGSITSYTFANVSSNHTIAVTFAANTFSVPQSATLLFSAMNDDLPTSGTITSWPTAVPVGGSLSIMGSPTVDSGGAQKWANNKAGGDGFHFGNYAMGNSIPMSGGTIVVVAKPGASMAANGYQCLVSVLLHQFDLCVDRNSLQIRLGRKNGGNDPNINTGVYLTAGQSVVLSYVVQPTGEITLYKNGVLIYTNTGSADFTSISAGLWYATDVNVGKGWNGDAWSSFNGNIGDVFVYKTALSGSDRQSLESCLTAKYGITAPFTLTASAGIGGTISPAGITTVSDGGSATFVAQPSLGYAVTNLVVDGVSQAALGSYTFSNVTANHTISVSFGSVPTYDLTVAAGANGSITPSGTHQVSAGASQTFTITPNTGYRVAGVLVDGVSQGALTSYTFADIQASHTISATFALQVLQITASSGGGGTISPNGTVNVNFGANPMFAITPNAGYAVSSMIIDGTDVGAAASYTFSSVIADHTISVVFVPGTRSIPVADQLLFGIDTKDLPATSAINSWPALVPSGSSLTKMGTPTVDPVGDQKWDNNKADGDGFHFDNVGWNYTTSAPSKTLPFNGGTIVVAAKPVTGLTGSNYQQLVSVLLNQFSIGIQRDSGRLHVWRGGTEYWSSYYAANGQPVVFSFVVQPTGGFSVYANGLQIMTNSDAFTFQNLSANLWYGTDVNVGKGWNGDSWSSFNGDIGDVFVYRTSLTDAQRLRLESNIMSKFGIGGGTGGTYTLTATAGANGRISPSGATTVGSGTSQSYTITPDPGYAISDVQIDGISMGVVGSYMFTTVLANHTISATFGVASSYMLTANAGGGGTISPAGTVWVTSGQDQTFVVTPDSGYVVLDVSVDGVSQGDITSYTFNSVVTNHSISASFTPIILNPSVTLARHAGTGSSSAYGDTLTFDVAVLGTPIPTGTVTLTDGGSNGAVIGSGSLRFGACTITPAYNALTAGTHNNIVAVYSGDSHFPVLVSPALDTQSVAQVALSVTGLAGGSKTYDGSTTAALTGTPVLSGLLGNDLISVGNATAGNFADPNVGTAKPITTALTLTGSASSNYVLTQPTGLTGNITARVVTLTGSKTYDGTTSIAAANLAISNNVDEGSLTLSGTTSLAGKDAGLQAIASHAAAARVQSATGNTGANTAATILVTLTNPPSNGNTLVAVITTRGSSINRVSSISQNGASWSRAAQAANSGGSTTEIWYAPNISGAGTAITINQAALRSAAVVMEYSGVLAINPLDQTTGTTGNGTAAATGTTAMSAQADELWIGGIGLVRATYTLSSYLNSFFFVASAQTNSGTSSNNAKVYALETVVSAVGTAATGGTVSTASNWSGAIATFKTFTPSSLALAGSAAANYTLTGATGMVSVTPKALTVTGLSATSRNYNGGTVVALTGTAALQAAESGGAGTVGDGKPYTNDTVTQGGTASGAFANKHIGTGKPVTVSGLTLGGANAGNYTLIQPVGLIATISAQPITVYAVTGTKTYDGTTTASGTPNVAPPLASGDTATTLNQTYQTKDAGEGNKVIIPAITINDGNGGANYQVALQNFTTGTIHQAAASVTLGSLTHIYDGTPQAATATTTPDGLLVKFTYNSLAVVPSAAGSYEVVATINELNYTGMVSGTMVIAEDPFITWQASHFTPAEIAAGLAAGDADPDGDGMSNQKEYAFGLDPRKGSSVNPIIVPLDKATGTFTYTRRDPALGTGMTYTVETSTDLVHWSVASATQVPGVTDSNGVHSVVVTLTPPPAGVKFFVQVGASTLGP